MIFAFATANPETPDAHLAERCGEHAGPAGAGQERPAPASPPDGVSANRGNDDEAYRGPVQALGLKPLTARQSA